MRFPDIAEYASYRSYFQEFSRVNQAARRSFSLRGFARKIGWPASYFGDLLSARKRLSLKRALEFAAFAKFDPFETQRLVFMVLEQTEKGETGRYFRRLLEREFTARYHRTEEAARSFSKYSSLEAFAVAALVRAKGRLPSPRAIRDLLQSFPDLDEDRIRGIVEELLRSKAVEVAPSGRAVSRPAVLDEMDRGFQWHQRYLENSIRAFDLGAPGVRPACLLSWFAPLPQSRFEAVRTRLLEVRNWLDELALEADALPESERGDLAVFQFDMNAFRITKAEPGPARKGETRKTPAQKPSMKTGGGGGRASLGRTAGA